MPDNASLLADIIDLHQRVDMDHGMDRTALKQRDRRIGMTHQTTDDRRQIGLWLHELRDGDRLSAGQHTDRWVRTVIASLWLLGLIAGAILARAALDYDGRVPVNLFSALLILVGVQLVALVVLLLLLLLRGRGLLRTLSAFNPAKLILALAARVSPKAADALGPLNRMGHGAAARRLSQSLVIYLSQHFAVALNLGITLMLIYLVAISDLAFGWNTTLDVDEAAVTRGFQAIALPWQSLLSEAVPSRELVDNSRFYRLAGQLRSTDWQVDQYGTWWLFVLMCIVTYGLLPRLIALVGFGYAHDRQLRRALLQSPGASQALARMRSPLVSTAAESGEAGHEAAEPRPMPRKRQPGKSMAVGMVSWSGALNDRTPQMPAGMQITVSGDAGGYQSLRDDHALITRFAGRKDEGVVVAVKAWEPPTLELRDFIATLRQAMGSGNMILVLLLALPDSQVTPTQLDTWETGLSSLADSALYVEAEG